MSFWDDLNRFAGHVVRGDLTGALGDLGQAAHDATSDAKTVVQAALAEAKLAEAEAERQKALAAGLQGRGTGVVVPPPPAMAGADHACCNRFTFNTGFLVDGATGRVWQFNANTNAFEEVAVTNSKVKQGLVNSLIESKLSSFRYQYEKEVLATIAPAQRAASLAQFEKDHLDPLRAAAQTLTY